MPPPSPTDLRTETSELGSTLAASSRVRPRARTWLSFALGVLGLAVGGVTAGRVAASGSWDPWGWVGLAVAAILTLAGWVVSEGHRRALASLRNRLGDLLDERRALAEQHRHDERFIDTELESTRSQMLEAYARTRFPGFGGVLALSPFLLVVGITGFLALVPESWDATENDRLAVTLIAVGGVPGLVGLGRSVWVTASAEIGLVNQSQRYLRHVESLARTHHPGLELGGQGYASRALRDPRVLAAVLALAAVAAVGVVRLLG